MVEASSLAAQHPGGSLGSTPGRISQISQIPDLVSQIFSLPPRLSFLISPVGLIMTSALQS